MDITYRELHRQEMTWIASHVAGDLLMMHNPDAKVDAHDWAKIVEARKRDAAMATLPRERQSIV